MKRHICTILCCLTVWMATGQNTTQDEIYVDKKGVMRWQKSRQEASFYGVNYTLPFAHAYRAIGYLGLDHKTAIDKDVYHFARLGFNAYRIHLWDVEISDEKGNLIENDHLDLFDYLVARLKERNISIVITAMTNFGNGYPEKNQPTGGFSYLYDKCDIHDNPEAIRAQQTYITSLIEHENPYTGKKYKDDPDIVGFEINNEPCHAGTQAQTRSYIQKMVQAIRKTGTTKPVFYNVTHNSQQAEAYYASPIQGTTYQWYPTGLVGGHTRYGNYLPNVDNYQLPFSTLKGFENKARLVYEFDPADITYSYMYPAMARSFRTAGFQWITQFAYDPIDIAWANTEYQTHFLNLAYTPQKAISMKIAAEVAYHTPMYADYGSYPTDTVFGDFRVSYKEDRSEMNTPEKFYYSNPTSTMPVNPATLQHIAGYGNSPIIRYEGTGAYFLDKLEEGIWRLEVMADAIPVRDPFERPSLDKEVVTIAWGDWDMQITLSDLATDFTIQPLNEGDNSRPVVGGQTVRRLTPGAYLLKSNQQTTNERWDSNSQWGNIRLGEFATPLPHGSSWQVNHQPPHTIEAGQPVSLTAIVAGPATPDSILIYTNKVSFWNDTNPYIKMERKTGYTWEATLPAEEVEGAILNYHLVICTKEKQYTFPEGIASGPLAWDYTGKAYYQSRIVAPTAPIHLFSPGHDEAAMESYIIPESWQSWNIRKEQIAKDPVSPEMLRFTFRSERENPEFFLRTVIRDKIKNRLQRVSEAQTISLYVGTIPTGLAIGFITSDGYTYKTQVEGEANSIIRIPLHTVQQTSTALLPHAYPEFPDPYFRPTVPIPFTSTEIEQLEISLTGEKEITYSIEIGSIWLE
ncbi:MAG: cellulase family glycosylhydrolase [Tannerellaceae bacterium]|nr:cellulase family glycosylhydrolase [Tannerellaceae bacterium]